MEMEFGWSWLKGVSPVLVTPEAIGYSKLWLWAMIFCPWAELRNATNFWSAA